MSDKKLDVKAVKEVLDFGYELFVTGKDVAGKGLNLAALPPHLVPLYTKAIPAIQDIGEVVPELADLDESEAAELVAFVATKGVANEHAQDVIAKSLNCAIAAYNLVKAIQA